jgi:hypothetical protein
MNPAKDDFDEVLRDATDALDFMSATHEMPSKQKEFFPWAKLLDPRHLGVAGHSGNGLTAYYLGHDPRIKAVVSMDVADIFPPPGFKIHITLYKNRLARKPTLVELAEGQLGPLTSKPVPDPESKYAAFGRLVADHTDAMRIVNRSSTHSDWSRTSVVTEAMRAKMPPEIAKNVKLGAQSFAPYGEYVGDYFMIAWFDRYLKGDGNPAIAADSLRRLTAVQFDDSADRHSIGVGLYDETKAVAGDPTSGNVPITIAGTPVRNLLSLLYPSSYFLDGGKTRCDDMRAGCGGVTNSPHGANLTLQH